MWVSSKENFDQSRRRGFTIVELLIVIVVIGILAAITIVAFNGVQKRAQNSAAQSAVAQASKKVMSYAITNSDNYPATATEANLVNSGDTMYQYTANNTSSPRTYCITVTVGTSNYTMSNAVTTPTSGTCTGHGTNGIPLVTNLALNPDIEVDVTGYAAVNAGLTRVSTGQSGSWHLAVTRVATGGDSYSAYPLTGFAIPGNVFTVSYWAKGNGTTALSSTSFVQEVGGSSRNYGSIINAGTVIPSTWTRYTVTFTAPADASSTFRLILRTGATANDLVDYDALMVTSGPTVYTYADGDSPGWVWNGTANNSTSSGPALAL